MLTVIWPLLIAVLGALVYAFAANPKLQNMGLVLFAVGIFWTVELLTGSSFSLGRH